jgi:hypothetical protein
VDDRDDGTRRDRRLHRPPTGFELQGARRTSPAQQSGDGAGPRTPGLFRHVPMR